MIVRLTVLDTATGASADVEVRARPESPLSGVLAELPVPVRGRPCFLGPRPLDVDGTVGAAALVQGAVLTVGAPGGELRGVPEGAAVGLHLARGGSSDGLRWLAPGQHVLGRSPGLPLALEDPEVSRRHAVVDVSPDGDLTLADLGSANGTTVGGAPILGATAWSRGLVVGIGSTEVRRVDVAVQRLQVHERGDGHLDVDRAFTPPPALTTRVVHLPAVPEDARGTLRASLVAGLVPLGLGVVMAALLRQPVMLLFALLGPLTSLAGALLERRRAGRREADAAVVRSRVSRQLADLVSEEARRRHARAPSLLDVDLAGSGVSRGLWPRSADSADALVLRLGTTDARASVELRGEPWPGFVPPTVTGVPFTVDLRAAEVLGIVGPTAEVAALTRALVVQLAVLRSPQDLRLVLLDADDGGALGWARWLPHLRDGREGFSLGVSAATRAALVQEMLALVRGRLAVASPTTRSGAAPSVRDVVLVLWGFAELRALPGLLEVLRDGPQVGVVAICVGQQDLHEYRGVATVDGAMLRLVATRVAEEDQGRWEGLTEAVAERLARALAPVRDRSTDTGEAMLPDAVRFVDLITVADGSAASLLPRWPERALGLRPVPVGADGAGIVSVHLGRQGPHVMLAGATGAGKSALLQTLVTSLMLEHRPDELTLVLVDFKGGGAFLPFARCPHVVALLRSTGETAADVFDEAAAVRVLASVRAEVRHRESLLAPFGGEMDHYLRERDLRPELPSLPRLVIVLDEFARVLEVSPRFLAELVAVAGKGRSLGMHLVLATQSLQGKLSPELKNNIDLRISLRQNEAADSVEVLGVPDAVSIAGRHRGRALLVSTKDERRAARPFQVGYLGGVQPVPGGDTGVTVTPVVWDETNPDHWVVKPAKALPPPGTSTDLQLIVRVIERAGSDLGLGPARRPVLPPLPADLPLSGLDAVMTRAPSPGEVCFGLLDDPDAQAQPPATFDLFGTQRLLVAGGPQSGRTTVVRALVTALVRTFRPDQVHLYLVEYRAGGLTDFAPLPHCGAVVGADEPDRLRRLATWLGEEVRRRSTSAASSVAEATEPARVVVVVDGWELIERRGDPAFVESDVLAMLRGVVAAGPPVGVHVVAVGGQDLLAGRTAELFSTRVLLPFAQEELRRIHLPASAVRPPLLAGRAVEAGTGRQLQVCRPDVDASVLVEQARRATRVGSDGRRPRTFPPLPAQVDLACLLARHAGSPRLEGEPAGGVPIGIGGADVIDVALDLLGADPHLVLVSGPGRSGRSTAACTFTAALRAVGVGVLAVCPPHSPLADFAADDPGMVTLTGTTFLDADLRTAAMAFGDGRYVVVLDDCDQVTLLGGDVGFVESPTLLSEIASPASRGPRALVLCGDASLILSGQRRSLLRVVTEVLAVGTRIVLTPAHPQAARELGVALAADQYFAGPPGRGYLVRGRATDLVQLAVPGLPAR